MSVRKLNQRTRNGYTRLTDLIELPVQTPRRWRTREQVLARIRELTQEPALRYSPTQFALNYKPAPTEAEKATTRGTPKQGNYLPTKGGTYA